MISPVRIIEKKRDGLELSSQEIDAFVKMSITGEMTDYQVSALLMAIYLKGMSLKETVALTLAMAKSGEQYDLSEIKRPLIDKHSTGGVGDKVSLILAPLAAACGLAIPMMSGRGLGHSGGTLDKLESIPGFRTDLNKVEFFDLMKKNHVAMIGQSHTIAPADRKFYALRDVTGTVECIPLITASILSKKIAEGTRGLVMDVKCGNGAFMKSRSQARALARSIKLVGKKMGLDMTAMITNMDQPLGCGVGHTLEVIESVEILRGKKEFSNECQSADLKELTLQLCGTMLALGKLTRNPAEGRKLALTKLIDGSAYQVFKEMVQAQGGDVQAIESLGKLPLSKQTRVFSPKKSGFVNAMDTEGLGKLLISMGGGRLRVSDKIDPSVGFLFHKKLGSKVLSGEPFVTVYAPSQTTSENWKTLEDTFWETVKIAPTRKPVPKLILDPNVK